MKIGDYELGYGHRPAIVAEIGAAHNGSLDTAMKTIRAMRFGPGQFMDVRAVAGAQGVTFYVSDGETRFQMQLSPADARKVAAALNEVSEIAEGNIDENR